MQEAGPRRQGGSDTTQLNKSVTSENTGQRFQPITEIRKVKSTKSVPDQRESDNEWENP